jgi:hypothetical protein
MLRCGFDRKQNPASFVGPMKFGIIGAGMIGHFHAKAIGAMTNGALLGV